MTDDGLPDDPEATRQKRQEWDEGKTTRDRVYETAIQLYDSADAATVAERADCSTDAARQHLEWFADVGIVERHPGRPTTYRRNESYFDWKRVDELRREYDLADLADRLADLTEKERAYRERYDADHPADVDALDASDHDAVHEVWLDLNDWRTVRREMRLLERARQEMDAGTGARANG